VVTESVDLLGLLRKQAAEADLDFLREAVAVLAEALMDAEVSRQIGAGYGERSPGRTTQRNGYRRRRWDTRVGTVELAIPKLREGSYFPALLEPRRRSERALLAVVQQAYVEGVSTRRIDDLVRALGCEGISKSQVSRICSELDAVVGSFLGGRSMAAPTATSGSTRSPRRCARTVAPRTSAWLSPPRSTPRAGARCWASTSARARTGLSGSASCAASWRAGSRA
jgi:hypothetical protein